MPPIPRRLKEDGRPVKAIGLISGGLDSTLNTSQPTCAELQNFRFFLKSNA